MSLFVIQAAICFIVCDGGPADHFSAFAQHLSKENIVVEIYATGPAFQKFQEKGIEVRNSFSIENISSVEEDILAEKIAKACSGYSSVITDVGHPFDIKLQKALARYAEHVPRFAYYDNPEPYVPGGYSITASQVMLASGGVLFANSHLAESPIFQDPSTEIDFGDLKKSGIGYYPVHQAEINAKRRTTGQVFLRKQFYLKNNIQDGGQKILVYFGGNNDEYYDKALPAFLSLLTEGVQRSDFSNLIIVFQQHPGARTKNLDVSQVSFWINKFGNRKTAPKVVVSSLSADDVQVMADAAFYYQTSMGPQLVLAGIPTIQIGHETYQDILVKNHLIPSVTDFRKFLDVIENLVLVKKEIAREKILESLGTKKNWLQVLKQTIY